MKYSIILKTITLILSVGSGVSIAQNAEEPNYRYDIGANINEMTLTQGGTLVVASNDGLVGIKPGNSSLLFNFTEYGRVKPDELYYVPDAPYVIVFQGGFANITSKKSVIDYMSGKTLFTTEGNGWKTVTSCDVMMPQNKLVVSGTRTSKEKYASQVAVYDLNTGKEDYRFDLGDPNRVGIAKVYAVTGRPLLLKNSLIVPTTQGIFAKKAQTGEILWETKIKDVTWLVADAEEANIYAFEESETGKNTKVYKLGASGNELWSDNAKVKGKVINFEILPQGLAIVSNKDDGGSNSVFAAKNESEIGFLSAASGEDLWEKAPKTKGYVQHFYIMDDGILFGIYQGGINKISFDGKTLFKKPLKTGENILTMAETPQGLIYITSEDANIVDLESGDQVWNKPLKYKRANAVSSAYDKNKDRYLISADETLFAIDATSGEISTLAESKFEGNEAPTGIEIRSNGILLTSDQNMMTLNWGGEKQWHEYYRAPGKSAMGAILAGVAAVASTAGAAAATHSSARNRLAGYNSQADRDSELAGGLAVAAGASISEMLKRFKATSATENAQFVLTKLDDGVGLVKLNKDTGSKEKEIVLKDKKPEYQVDDFGGLLYYKADNNSIFVYDLN